MAQAGYPELISRSWYHRLRGSPPPRRRPRRWWERVRSWLLGTTLVAALLAVVGKGAADWAASRAQVALGGAVDAGNWCLAGEWWHTRFGRPDPTDPARFRILIAQLDRDPDGALSRKTVDAFRGASGMD